MGKNDSDKFSYTQYFEQGRCYTEEEWKKITEAADIVIDYFAKSGEVLLVEDHFTKCVPTVNEDRIQFNGYTKEGQETFFVFKDYCFSRELCKTNKKPYDLAVCIIILSIHSIAPDVLTIRSDGSWEKDWKKARDLYQELFLSKSWLKKPLDCPWKETSCETENQAIEITNDQASADIASNEKETGSDCEEEHLKRPKNKTVDDNNDHDKEKSVKRSKKKKKKKNKKSKQES